MREMWNQPALLSTHLQLVLMNDTICLLVTFSSAQVLSYRHRQSYNMSHVRDICCHLSSKAGVWQKEKDKKVNKLS